MTQCQEQADAVIKRLEDTKFKLLEKRDQLKKSLAFAWDIFKFEYKKMFLSTLFILFYSFKHKIFL